MDAEPAERIDPTLPPPGETIDADLACASCGYNLRGLTIEMCCPECGAGVSRSIHGDLLAYADPGWLNRLRRGTALKLWSFLAAILAAVAGLIAVVAGAPQATPALFVIPAGLLGLWAVLLITTQEPRIALSEDTVSLRRFVRVGALVGLLQHGGEQLAGSLTELAQAIVGILIGLVVLFALAATLGEFVYYRRFARRIPDERLEKQTTVVMWGTGVSLGLMGLGMLISVLMGGAGTMRIGAGPAPGAAPPMPAMCLTSVGGLGALIFGIWNVVLLFSYLGAFRRALLLAESGPAAPGTAVPLASPTPAPEAIETPLD